MTKKGLISLSIAMFLLLSGFGVSNAYGQKSKKEMKKIEDAREISDDAAEAFKDVMAVPEKAIPERLLKDAKAIAVFPKVIKAGFIFGGRGGKGIVSRRLKSGWSAPVVFKLTGGSAGFQIGATSSKLVLLFMTDDSLKHLLESKFELGADAAAAAGPVGRTAEAATDLQLQAQILSYSKSKGLFAGVSLEGSVIKPDDDDNEALYGMGAKEMLTGVNKVAIADVPDATSAFHQAISKY